MRIDWRFGKKKKEEADAHSNVDIEQPADAGLAEPAEPPSIDTVIDTSNTSDDVPGIFTPEPSNPSTLVVRSGSASNKGMHARNEDCVKDGWWCSCFVVSDGIGGAPDGDYMSRVACGAVVESYEESHDIERAFSFGNVAAITVSKWIDSPDCGATLLVAGLEGDDLTCAWCGDSVAYRLRDGEMLLLTEPAPTSWKAPSDTRRTWNRRSQKARSCQLTVFCFVPTAYGACSQKKTVFQN